MRKFLQRLLRKPVARLADKYSSRPDKRRVNAALNKLFKKITSNPSKRGLLIPFNPQSDKFIIFSDLHKGARDHSDIFALSERNYIAALDHYYREGFTYVNLGDSEELWENLFLTVKNHNKETFEKEKLFLQRKSFIKVFGNHDLYWDNDPLAAVSLLQIYGEAIKVHEGVILQTVINNKPLFIFMTHGHQGDLQSDGNWFSKWFVSNIWAPLQSFLELNINTPANNDMLKTDHNRIMYEWSAKKEGVVLITGHTHQPVFASLTHLEKLYADLMRAKKDNDVAKMNELQKQINLRHEKGEVIPDFNVYVPTYFNTGCCCFNDGDITGIEIEGNCIRLIKWEYNSKNESERFILEEAKLETLANLA